MASHLQLLRGTTAQNNAYTGLAGEVTVDSQSKTVRVHDGATKGGCALVNENTIASTDARGLVQVGYGLRVENGVLSVGCIDKPRITSPAAGSDVITSGFTAKSSAFRAVILTDTHISTRWIIKQNDTIVVDITSLSDLLSHDFTFSELSGLVAGPATLQVQYTGASLGDSVLSDPVAITVSLVKPNAPVITAPTTATEFKLYEPLTVTTNAFSMPMGTDTHKNTDWAIATDATRTNIVLQASASADKTSHTFPFSELDKLDADTEYYIHARHRGTTTGESDWATPSVVTSRGATEIPGGRKLYRHSSDMGTVIIYNEFGTTKQMLVYDAAIRKNTTSAYAPWRYPAGAVSGVNNWRRTYGFGCIQPGSSMGKLDLSQEADLVPYMGSLSDTAYQSALSMTMKSVLQTAKAATDIMVADSYCAVADLCRMLGATATPDIEAQLPNVYQLLVIYACGDYLDNMDPSVSSYPENALGKYGWNAARWFNGGAVWSSTGYDDLEACVVDAVDGITHRDKSLAACVLPIAEL